MTPSEPGVFCDGQGSVALVSYSDMQGGAARAAYRLHRALRQIGIESSMVVREKLSDDPRVLQVPARNGRLSRAARSRGEGWVLRGQRKVDSDVHSVNAFPTRLSRVLDASVVNLHWVGAGTISIKDVARIAQPIVWTLHDMWAFCGSEHYTDDGTAARWRRGYTLKGRPADHRGLDLDRWTWRRKRRWWPEATVVTPSRWLADCARSSVLMRDWPVHVIPYPMDATTFRPYDRAASRVRLGLPTDCKLIVFGALGGGRDTRKGFDLLVRALHQLDSTSPLLGVVFGEDEPPNAPKLPFRLHWLGHVASDAVLAQIYSAADVVVVPSRQDNLPQTALEAQTCGRPVVAFDTGGLPDAIASGDTGLLAEPFSPSNLAFAISEIIENETLRDRLGDTARRRALRLWHPETVASSYAEVYRATLAQARST